MKGMGRDGKVEVEEPRCWPGKKARYPFFESSAVCTRRRRLTLFFLFSVFYPLVGWLPAPLALEAAGGSRSTTP